MNPLVKSTIDHCFGLLCRHCNRKVLDPDKAHSKQKYTEDNCPYCGKSGNDPVEEAEEPEEKE